MANKGNSEIKLKNPDDLYNLTQNVNSIITKCNGNVSLERMNTIFMNETGSTIKSWFVNAKKITLYNILKEVYPATLAFDAISHKPHVIVSFKLNSVENEENEVEILSQKTVKQCEEDLKKNVAGLQGTSKNLAIDIDEDSEPEQENQSVWKDISWNIANSMDGNLDINKATENFKLYREYQLIHVTYSKLRIIEMCHNLNKSHFLIRNFKDLFNSMFRENFLSNNVLKHFVSESENTNQFEMIVKFLKRFCGDLLDIDQNQQIEVIGNIPALYTRYLNELVMLIGRLEAPVQIFNTVKDPTPAEMLLLGKCVENNEHVDVRAVYDHRDNRTPLTFFPGPNEKNVLHGKQRPSMDEINERVKIIRNKICREGNAVKIVDILRDLCQFYQVACVQDLRPYDRRPLTKESDIPAMYELIRSQGKINAFIQAFVTFRNICTLHELHEEICQMEQKSSFEELKLGPFQKQLLVYDYFQFPPTHDSIPTITTMDVFKLLWKLQTEMHHKQKNDSMNTSQNREKAKMKLDEFMEYFIKEYSFKTPFESGVRINSIGLAIQVVRRSWFSDMHNIKNTLKDFNKAICNDLKTQLLQTASSITNRCSIVQNYNEFNNLTPSIAGMNLADGFNEFFSMIKKLKREASKKIPSDQKILYFSETVQDTFMLIKKDKILSKVFHVLLSTAPLKTLEKDDVAILKYLGFQNAIKEIISEEENNATHRNQNKKVERPERKQKSIVTKAVRKWLEKNTNLDIKSLSKIESQIIAELDPHLDAFEDLGHGSFLKFICSNGELFQILSSHMCVSADNDIETCAISRNDLIEFVQQCSDLLNKEDILNAISSQFNMNNENKKFITGYLQQPKEANKNKTSNIIYQHTLLFGTDYYGKDQSQLQDNCNLRELAKQAIIATPYLQSIEQWTNWYTVYEKACGTLKEFIRKEVKDQVDFTIMTVTSNHHVKVINECSIDLFTKSTESLDAEVTCLCIISLIHSSGHIKNAPIALLGNQIQSAFLAASKKHENGVEEDDIIKFTLECFRLIPFAILSNVVTKLFLTPLSVVYGSINVSLLLLNACQQQQQQQRSILHALGIHLSNSLWIDDMKEQNKNHINYNKKLLDKYKDDIEVNDEREGIVNDIVKLDDIDEGLQAELHMEVDDTNSILIDDTKRESKEKTKSGTSISTDDDETVNDLLPNVDLNHLVESIETNTTVSSTTKPIDHCFSIIEKIRREQFGIGVEFGDEQKKLIEVHREREGRSLHRLSRELYTRDSHFVLELIQNADDNEYKKFSGSEIPTVAFIVEKDKIVILNNEKGFAEKNIRALCDVGKSTKGIHRKGYIGQKGIGFKSVFRVTDSPEIHSNGYHIKFDASTGPNGYILPVWVDEWKETDQLSYQPPGEIKYNWTTQIILPLKKEMQHTKLTSRFHDVHPSLLMFLNRLHKIIIDDRVTGTMKIMEKSIQSANIIQLCENNCSTLWFVVSKEITIKLQEEARTTDISVAFPIKQKNLMPQPVFAFLPLRSYGFKFIIQADFEVPSSREDIDKDSAWNQCILQNLPSLVIQAFHQFKNHCHFNDLEGVIEYFRFMDVEDHVLGIFRHVAKNIIKSLKKEHCFPIIQHNEANEDTVMVIDDVTDSNNDLTELDTVNKYQWALPSSIIMSNQNISETITSIMLKEFLGLTYLHDKIQSSVSHAILKLLGISNVTLDQLVDIVKSYMKFNINSSHNDNNKQNFYTWLGKWFALLYTTLQEACDFTEVSLDKIRELPIFPLSDGRFVTLKDNVVFLPVDGNVQPTKKTKKGQLNQCLQLIEKDLNILCRSLTENVEDQIEQDQVIRLLKDLGMRSIQPKDLIHDHIIPIFKNGSGKEKSKSLLISFVQYIFQQYLLDTDIIDIKEAANYLVLQTNQGLKELKNEVLYIPQEYGNPIDLGNHLQTCKWLAVSPVYATNSSHQEVKAWCDFFKELGLHTFAQVRREEKSLHLTDLNESVWKNYSVTWDQTVDDTYIIKDLVCPEFNSLIDANNVKEIKYFTSLMNQHWDEYFKTYDLSKPCCDVMKSDRQVIGKTYSSLFIKMRSTPWLSSSSQSNQLTIPRDLFVQSKVFESLLSNKVSYINKEIDNKDFIITLGCITDLKIDAFMKEFKKWTEDSSFTTSYGHVLNIYKYLASQAHTLGDVISHSAHEKFIFIPTKNRNQVHQESTTVTGKFFKTKQVCWVDPSDMFSHVNHDLITRHILKGFYPNSLQDFFTNNLQVDYYPTGEEYLNLVCKITSMTSLPDSEECKKIYSLLSVLGETFLTEETSRLIKEVEYPDQIEEQILMYNDLEQYVDQSVFSCLVQANISEKNIFPTSLNVFTSLIKNPVLVFNEDLARPFRKNNDLPLLYVNEIYNLLNPSTSKRHNSEKTEQKFLCLLLFFKACGVPSLQSIYLEPEVVTEQMSRGSHRWEEVLHKLTPVIQRFIKTKLPKQYRKMQVEKYGDEKVDFKTFLFNSKFCPVANLEVIYRLSDRSDINVRQPKIVNTEFCGSKALIYIINSAIENNSDDIITEMLKIFTHDNNSYRGDILEFVLDFIGIPNKESYLTRKKLVHISSQEELWVYPEPLKPVPKAIPKVIVTENKVENVENKGPKGVTCWPPRNPGNSGGGFMVKPESVRKEEQEILEKWARPDAPGNAKLAQTTEMEIDKPLVQSSTAGADISPNEGSKRKREPSEQSNESYESTEKPKTKKPYVESGESKTNSSETKIRNSQGSETEIVINGSSRSDSTSTPIKLGSNSIPGTPSSEHRRHIFNADFYTTFDIETQYEDLPISIDEDVEQRNIVIEASHNDNADAVKLTGQRGEQLVYQQIVKLYEESISRGEVTVEWLNNENETGEPYDIIITSLNGLTSPIYIEVKTTLLNERKEFLISSQQIKFAFEHAHCFHLYRVSGLADKETLKIKRLVNLATYLDNKSVKLFMIL